MPPASPPTDAISGPSQQHRRVSDGLESLGTLSKFQDAQGQVLTSPDLLPLIVDALDWPTIAALCRVNHFFFEISANFIWWELENLNPLVPLLPARFRAPFLGNDPIPTDPSNDPHNDNWERFKVYSNRVRSLCFTVHRHPDEKDVAAALVLSREWAARPPLIHLFPGVLYLTFAVYWWYRPLPTQLLNPSLRTLSIDLERFRFISGSDERAVRPLLADLTNAGATPNLESFTYSGPRDPRGVLNRVFSKSLTALRSLSLRFTFRMTPRDVAKEVLVPILHEASPLHRTLESLALDLEFCRPDDFTSCCPPLQPKGYLADAQAMRLPSPHSFRALKSIDITTCTRHLIPILALLVNATKAPATSTAGATESTIDCINLKFLACSKVLAEGGLVGDIYEKLAFCLNHAPRLTTLCICTQLKDGYYADDDLSSDFEALGQRPRSTTLKALAESKEKIASALNQHGVRLTTLSFIDLPLSDGIDLYDLLLEQCRSGALRNLQFLEVSLYHYRWSGQVWAKTEPEWVSPLDPLASEAEVRADAELPRLESVLGVLHDHCPHLLDAILPLATMSLQGRTRTGVEPQSPALLQQTRGVAFPGQQSGSSQTEASTATSLVPSARSSSWEHYHPLRSLWIQTAKAHPDNPGNAWLRVPFSLSKERKEEIVLFLRTLFPPLNDVAGYPNVGWGGSEGVNAMLGGI